MLRAFFGALSAFDRTTPMREHPTPGSREALALGCKCPVIDNRHGRGWIGTPGATPLFVKAAHCPLHGTETQPNQEESQHV